MGKKKIRAKWRKGTKKSRIIKAEKKRENGKIQKLEKKTVFHIAKK